MRFTPHPNFLHDRAASASETDHDDTGAEVPLALAASDAVLHACTCTCRAPLCMVMMRAVSTSAPDAFFTVTVDSATLEKTTVPSTQTTVFDTGTGAAASLATRFASLKDQVNESPALETRLQSPKKSGFFLGLVFFFLSSNF